MTNDQLSEWLLGIGVLSLGAAGLVFAWLIWPMWRRMVLLSIAFQIGSWLATIYSLATGSHG